MAYRFAIIFSILFIAYGVLGFHLYEIQLVKGGYYYAKAQSQSLAAASTNASRGAIYFTDKDGNTLPAAVNQEFPTIYAVPSAIKNVQEAAATFAPVLDMPQSTLLKTFNKPKDSYELLTKKADASVAQKVTDINMPGVYADFEPERFYPLSTVASQILGFVGPNSSNAGESGHYGLEKFYDDLLSGSSTDPGDDLTLTIDPNIQIEAEKVLDNLVKANNATGGSVIVEDPETGKILAMGNDPSFDPNDYGSYPLADLTNVAVQSVYEPGSIFKVITMAAGIDAGKITPNTTYTDTGSVTVNGARITNYDLTTHGPYGPGTTMTNVIEHSINTGAVFAESKIGNDIFTNYLKEFGFNQKTGVDLPGEVAGNMNALTPKARQVAFATASYGQGVAVTTLELINAISAIANGGVLMRPYVNAALSPQPIRRVISESTAAQVAKMMVSAVDKAGVASIEGYSLAGKTGSAFIPDLVHGGYTDKLIDSYVGFGPTSNPRFVALIRLNTLPSSALAAESVVPAFRELSQYIVNYYNIPPDRLTAGARAQ